MQIIRKYFPDLTQKQIEQFNQLQALYELWNERINVISRKDIDQLYERHVLHSLSIACFFQFKKESRILDVGTGGGFPGIPLAILFPEVRFTLVDSIGKKINVVKEIASAIGLENIEAYHARAESIPMKFDFVVSRAVTEFPVFVSWVKNSFSKQNRHEFANGIIYIKGGDFESELIKYPKAKVFSISERFEEPFFETKKIIYLPNG
jgi:16S rRNA (guanine527-N7)-methyltransferase